MLLYERMLNRRSAMMGAGGIAAAAVMDASPVEAASGVDLDTPEGRLTTLVRLMASTKEEDSIWYYSGRIYAQIGETAPRAICGMVGAETYWPVRQADGSYLLSASTFSYVTALDGGPLDVFQNPFTGAANKPVPNIYRNDKSSVMTPAGMIHTPGVAPDPYVLTFSTVGDSVFLVHDVGQANMPQPHRELSTIIAPRKEFYDPRVQKIPAVSSVAFVSRWPTWMQMGDRPGHTIWYVASKKLNSPAELPEPYRKRLMAEHPLLISARPGTPGSTSQVY
jgi:hypothetical protein